MEDEDKILFSYNVNATEWSNLIRKDLSETRKKITNPAIISAILSQSPSGVVDLGAGEGWLVRELCNKGIDAIGIEGSSRLIEAARHAHENERYINAAYHEIAHNKRLQHRFFDLAVANFSLIGKESTQEALRACSESLLKPGGHFIIQTLHPCFYVAAEGDEYRSGWRKGTWAGLPGKFSEPAPWYFRTIEDWTALFNKNNFKVSRIVEPRKTVDSMPVSIIFILAFVGGREASVK